MKILVRATNWVGDAIMAMPALRAVRAKFPGAGISILGLPYVIDIYRDQELADRLIAYDRDGQHSGLSGKERLAAELRAEKFDSAILLQNAFDAAWIAWRSGIPERIGYNRDGRGLLLTKPVAVPRPGEIPPHEKYYYLELLRRVGWLDTLPDVPAITMCVDRIRSESAESLLQSLGAQPGAVRLAIGAGASYGSAKCWPPDRFSAALNQIAKERKVDVVLFGTPSDAAVTTQIEAGLDVRAINLVGKTKITELPALLSRCSAFLGNDSGAMHVAAAVGLPVVAVFGPTDPRGTAPVTPRCTIVQDRPYCSPCFLRRCPTDHRCMTVIPPEKVSARVLTALSEASTA